jgi:hypothetical protein
MKRYGFRRRHARRSNPGIAGFSTNELLKLALGAGAGVVGSKYLAQAVLGSSNTGYMGYAGQAVATLALAWGAHKFVGKDAATGVVAGGLGALALRIFQEQISQTQIPAAAAPVSGLGDPDMASLGVGLREYRGASINVPATFGPGMALAPPARGVSRGRG